jgi:hypothetical protein
VVSPLLGMFLYRFLKLSSDHRRSLKPSCKIVGQHHHQDKLIGSISRYYLLEVESLRERNIIAASLSSQSTSGEKEEASAMFGYDLYLLTDRN